MIAPGNGVYCWLFVPKYLRFLEHMTCQIRKVMAATMNADIPMSDMGESSRITVAAMRAMVASHAATLGDLYFPLGPLCWT